MRFQFFVSHLFKDFFLSQIKKKLVLILLNFSLHLNKSLLFKIEKRALEVWGSPEALEDERERRESKRELAKKKRFQRNMKKLRQEVRASAWIDHRASGPCRPQTLMRGLKNERNCKVFHSVPE